MSKKDDTFHLYQVRLSQGPDVVMCRNRARLVAEGLGFDDLTQARVATAVSEIARNAVNFAGGGFATFNIGTAPAADTRRLRAGPRPALVIGIEDRGPGIQELQTILGGSGCGTGRGLLGAKRLMDHVEFETSLSGTRVTLYQVQPVGTDWAPELLEALAEKLHRAEAPTAMDELARQNRELLQALEELQSRGDELETMNQELSETNRGVVALYDELDTVYRVGRMVAAKLELQSLFESIMAATTEVSGAQLGAFYYQEPDSDQLTCRAVKCDLADNVELPETASFNSLLGGRAPNGDVFHIPDLSQDAELSPLHGAHPLRSYMAIAIQNPLGEHTGVMVYGHRIPGYFTERTERILSSVSVQVSIGIENAQLFSSMQAANVAKDQFLAILSHELRTPLSPVFTILSALEQREDLDCEMRRDLVVMRRNLQLEARLIDDLLDLTRIVKGKVPLNREVVDIHTLIKAVCETCEAEIHKKFVKLDLELEASKTYVNGDAARLQQVLWNLLSNAVKFSPAGGRIAIVSQVDRDQLHIRIEDQGRGIEKEALHQIFEPFVQANPRISHQFGGLGLGLAISKSIIDAHGGRISAESEGPGKGATFTITQRLADDEVAPKEFTVTSEPDSQNQPTRILLVDDHEDTRVMYARILKRSGYEVLSASNCTDALRISENQHFDIIISDLGLPDGNGHDLMRKIRQREPSAKGIALSGYGMESDVERSMEAGFEEHLTKPVEYSALVEAMQRVLAK